MAAQAAGASGLAVMTNDEIDRVYRLAQYLHASHFFKDIDQAEQAFAKILLGRDLGLSSTQSLMGLDVVHGNLQLRGTLLGKFVNDSPIYDYKVPSRGFEPGNEFAIVALYKRDDDGEWPLAEEDETFPTAVGDFVVKKGRRLPEGVEGFNVGMARRMGLVKTGGSWDKIPQVMVVWRALAQLVRFHAPELLGGSPIYAEGEFIPEPVREDLGGGDGPTTADDAILPPAVERIMERAKALGHDGLQDRATMEMTVAGQSEEFVAEKVAEWTAELDAMGRDRVEPEEEVTDATVVQSTVTSAIDPVEEEDDDGPGTANPQGMRDHANLLMDQVIQLREEGQDTQADELEDRASSLMAEADALDGGPPPDTLPGIGM
jgi:hypothetical protein